MRTLTLTSCWPRITGAEVELVAPRLWNQVSCYCGGKYRLSSGTSSMATPLVTGAIALLLESYERVWEDTGIVEGDGEWTNDELREVLRGTAKDLGDKGRDDLFGYGLLNFDFPVREESVSAVSSPAGEEEEELEGRPVVSKKLA